MESDINTVLFCERVVWLPTFCMTKMTRLNIPISGDSIRNVILDSDLRPAAKSSLNAQPLIVTPLNRLMKSIRYYPYMRFHFYMRSAIRQKITRVLNNNRHF